MTVKEALVSVANRLDKKNLIKEANYLDEIIRKIAADEKETDCLEDSYSIKINFKRNEFKIENKEEGADSPLHPARCLINKGMQHDRKFMSVAAGTSGTGTSEANAEVMEKRVNEALEYIFKTFTGTGPNDLPYSYDEFKNMANIKLDFNTERPGATIHTKEEAPGDVDHIYYEEHQWVKIDIGPIQPVPNYGRLAVEFVQATIKRQGLTGTDDDKVFEILASLRDTEDFDKFNEALVSNHKISFYEIACHTGSEVDPLLGEEHVPSLAWAFFTWARGKWKEHGPEEIGSKDKGVIGQLQRLAVPQINCDEI